MLALRSLRTMEAVEALIMAFEYEVKSDMLKHEICYSLGQMDLSKKNEPRALAFLEKVVQDTEQSDFVRHEAIEALDDINEDITLKVLETLKQQQTGIVYETYYLKKRQIEWEKATEHGKTEGINLKASLFDSDPAPWYNYKADTRYADVGFLQRILLDDVNYDMFERNRALFTLRELNTEESLMAICQCFMEAHLSCSDLLKHQAAFVVRQMETLNKAAGPILLKYINSHEVSPLVMHEVLVTLGWIIEDRALITPFLEHPDLLVSESCELAISVIE